MKRTTKLLFSVLLSLIVGIGMATSASAALFAMGDNTPAFYASDNDNNAFFSNILEGGTNVVAHELYGNTLANNFIGYYNSLAGVSASYDGNATITSSLLSGADLFVTGLFEGALSLGEVNALSDFMNTGGSILFMADYTDAVTSINSALAGLGSGMQLFGAISDIGDQHATGSSIAVDPYTAGVSSLRYGATYGVSGGTSLFFDSGGRAFAAYDGTPSSVPEPATLVLLGAGLLGLVRIRKRII